jgi:hypothetical protein
MADKSATPSIKLLAAAIAEIDGMSEAEAKAALAAQRTAEYFAGHVKERRPASKSGSHRLGAGALTIGQAVIEVCRGVWLAPEEILAAVASARPGTNSASVYPEIMRQKKAGALLQKGEKYRTA